MKRLALVLLFACAAFAQQPAATSTKKPLTIEAVFAEGGITGRAPETVQWSPDGTKLSFVQRDDSGEHGALYYVDVAGGAAKPAVLVAEEKLANLQPPPDKAVKDEREKERRARYSVAGYHWAPDSKHLLFDSGGQLWLYSLASGTAVVVGSGDDPKFSPDGTRIAYVKQHNLFVRDLKSNKEKALTKDSDENLLNGEVDWVYAEELDVRSNYFWSPDGKRIVFLQMNESKVPAYPITDWVPTHPTVDMQKYPKAGDPNAEVRLGVVNSDGGSVKWMDVAGEYIPRFGWLDNGTAWVEVLNRDQDKLDLYFADAGSGRSRAVLHEQSDAWIEVNDAFKPLASGGKFLWSSWRDGHTHLYLYSFEKSGEAKLERQVTKGDWDTFGIQAVDEKTGTVYYVADEGDDRQRHLYSVKLDGSGMQRVTNARGTHSPSFAPDGKHYVDNYSALMTPPQMSVCAVGGSCSTFWNARPLTAFDLITPQFVDFKAEDGTVLHGTLLVNPILSSRSAVLMNPYGGPSGQVSRDAWGGTTFLFHQLLARDGIAILQVDNRGMGNRGKKFAAALKHNFGEVEFKDQLASLDQALAKYPFLDRARLGWWGWSYGGYMTLYAMTHSDRVKAGVSVAPVTDWRNYDTIYTERYMSTPDKNAEGYKKSSPVNFAANLSGALIEVHGTGDDNVHVQNSIQMTNAFITAGKQFRLMVYPRKTHGITGTAARTHLFHMIQDHLERELLGKMPATVEAPAHSE
ncbi:MAG: DPP IV N-terminal domain-containing protein [Candidatus Koribacter versatilis]|uniref:DPP IV N-terminal domain-containing protein n=1 Tax=Candidatus Korobacter versatilis TaxID=658062 RepID=A0A932A865_9BACT|nr:DPP IV N-terminal domain-containing protein [Candidatus Koribacter versatilis]